MKYWAVVTTAVYTVLCAATGGMVEHWILAFQSTFLSPIYFFVTDGPSE